MYQYYVNYKRRIRSVGIHTVYIMRQKRIHSTIIEQKTKILCNVLAAVQKQHQNKT